MTVPLFNETADAKWKPVTAVGIADLKDGSGNALTLGDLQFESTLLVFDD